MKKTYCSNGKLLITGEYVVLDGVMALAIPTKYGQSLTISEEEGTALSWESKDEHGSVWFEATFSPQLLLNSTTHPEIAHSLLEILKKAKQLNPQFLSKRQGLKAVSQLDFPRNWGLGSSSTLINNIAQWAGVDAFVLLEESFGGSGYDIAAAQSNVPVLFTRNNNTQLIQSESLAWEFTEQLFFVHLNQKQNSKEGIARYKKAILTKKVPVNAFSEITKKVVACKTLPRFVELLTEHEALISSLIELPTVQKKLFPDYSGFVKSLGAWGGDFVLVTGEKKDQSYFRKKGYHTIVPFSEMIK